MAKRVVIVLYFYQCTGGAHRYLHAVCEYWRRRGYEFEVWYYRAEQAGIPVPPYAHRLPQIYPVRWLYMNRALQLAVATAAELHSRRRHDGPMPDAFVVLDSGEALLIGVVAAMYGIDVVHNDRGTDEYFRSVFNMVDYAFYRLAYRLSRPFVTRWVVASAAKKDELTAMGIPAEKISLVGNGLQFYVPSLPPVYADGDDSGAVSIGYFSRASRDRGMDIAFAMIRLLNTGDSTMNKLFVMTVDERHIPDDLRDCEWVVPLGTLSHSDVASWMAQVDVVVVPTRSESFGNTVIESLYYGAFVLASAVGSLTAWKDMPGLVLVEKYEQPEEWVDALTALLPQIRTRRHRQFREDIAALYNLERQAEALYREFTGEAEES